MKVTGIGRCVRLLSNSGANWRNALYITKRGFFATYERPSTNGGWTIKESILIEWPWKSQF